MNVAKNASDITGLGGSIADLRTVIADLVETNQDLELTLQTAIDHGDSIEEQLYDTNTQLVHEARERKAVETLLKKLLNNITLQKDDLELLIETITDHSDILDYQLFEQISLVEGEARTDSLTALANRRHFDYFLHHEWSRGIREKEPLSLILMDIDLFKLYNDHYGHPAGDVCLKTVADVIAKTCIRATDLVARYGGEEFGVILPNTDQEQATIVAENIRSAISEKAIPHEFSSVSNTITLSMGVATQVPDPASNTLDYIIEADQLLYRAKQTGRNHICHGR